MIRRFQLNTVSNLAAAAVLVVALCGAYNPALADPGDDERMPAEHGTLSGPPVMAVVSIKDQRISLYDANGGALRAPVSSGQTSYETPIGIYSVLQKNKEHYSNVYDDAAMPFMQRITWSGVALHQGQLPGYPASHGCVRMPESLAEEIFPLTKIGMRVVIARDQVVPIEIMHPHLLTPSPLSAQPMATRTSFDNADGEDEGPRPFAPDLRNWPERQAEMDALKTAAAEKAAEVEQRKVPIADLKDVVVAKTRAHASATKGLRAADAAKKSADDKVAAAGKALAYAKDPARLKPWETAKAKADAAVLTATDQIAKANDAVLDAPNDRQRTKAERSLRSAGQAKQNALNQATRAERDLEIARLPARYKKQEDAVAKMTAAAAVIAQKQAAAAAVVQSADAELQTAKQELATADAALDFAVKAAKVAKRKTLPVSLFVSLKTQRVYVRQGHEPVMDMPIAITDPAKPIGTHVFTAVDYENGANALRWTAVTLAHQTRREVAQLTGKSKKRSDVEPELFLTDGAIAAAALDRVTLPPEVLESVSASVWPGSSLIVSDEGLHKETNDATDFIVLMSGELQGGIKSRPKPKPLPLFDDENWNGNPNANFVYDRYGRKMRIVPKKSFFDWW